MQLLPANRVALVTGSGRGLGRTIAEKLADAGAAVILHDHRPESPSVFGEAPNLDAVIDQFRERGAKVVGVTADVADYEAMTHAVQIGEEALGPITILVNCAGGDIGASGKGKPDPNDALGISPLDRYANPAEIADATLFLASNLARFVTGQVLAVDGGLTTHAY